MQSFDIELFAKRLKDLREDRKKYDKRYTQGYVAEIIGVARTTYTAYENGTKEPPLGNVYSIAELFDVTSDYLLGKSNDPRLTADEDNRADSEVEELMKIIESMPADRRKEMEEKILAYAKGLADASADIKKEPAE